MDAHKTLEVINLYREKLVSLNVPKKRFPIEKHLPLLFRKRKALSHCHQMLDQMEVFVRENRMEKAFRWLGFVQGVLWAYRLNPVLELKNHNRPAE